MEKSNINLNSKLPRVGSTIFSKMTQLANQHHAINLSQGFPDFEADPKLLELVDKYMHNGDNQYAPMAGVLPLRKKLSEISDAEFGCSYDIDKEITVTAGATQAIATAVAATIREGDEVILFSPAYDCYAPMVELHGGIPVFVKLIYPDYSINWEYVKKVLSHRTRMIILNNPHNPSGSILKESDLRTLTEITENSNILILSDEVYENILLNGETHQSVRRFSELAARSFVIGSLGKTLHVTGWKIGYCMAPENLMREFQKVHQYLVFSVNTPVQYAIAEYLEDHETDKVSETYRHKRDLFLEFTANSRFKPLTTHGGYFQLMEYSDITREADVEFAERLTTEYGVAAIPLSVFYSQPTDHKVLRFCFAKNEETLRKAGLLLSKV